MVDEKFHHKKVQSLLQFYFEGLSCSLFYKTLRKKDIKVNGKRISENIEVLKDDVVEIYVEDQFLLKTFALDIVDEDENILIVNKPIHLEVISNTENDLTKEVQKKYPSLEDSFPYPCHRLDRNTSGLVLYAKNQMALDILNEKIEKHEILKFYQCTVVGILDKKQATLKDYLFKDCKKSIVHIRSTPKPGYKEIITSYKVINEDLKNNLSTLEVQLHTR